MSSLKSDDLQRIFNKLDQNDDGYVSLAEIAWLLDKIGVRTGPEELESIVGQERLDLQEFMFFYEKIADRCEVEADDVGRGEESDLLEAFKVFDLNNDGFISSEELQCVLSRLGLWEDKSGYNCRSMIREFDINSDGLLDFEEFKRMMLLAIP
ncbi:PREDICTED: probable calcium-binding protein CML44 [Nelumbo nucifera]|uniref:EF-hand domain-containing protein n=2 Tax=Nelumbo nucifera TaxID=4432 RepID=A0A822Z5E5_NELNU|nr:PREDICTED: probable calcium-binding protein CML44 [Nelumbo nucifera]DAD39810.1 TPA_asm: hypothetical protein HUJ06_014133 [Nelumbo nucifera]